jgi:hypothetical protein
VQRCSESSNVSYNNIKRPEVEQLSSYGLIRGGTIKRTGDASPRVFSISAAHGNIQELKLNTQDVSFVGDSGSNFVLLFFCHTFTYIKGQSKYDTYIWKKELG